MRELATGASSSISSNGAFPMSRLLDVEAVAKVLERAFCPLRCYVSVSDRNQKLAFAVFDEDGNPILRVQAGLMGELREPYSLRCRIDLVRAHLETEGFKLDAFASPT